MIKNVWLQWLEECVAPMACMARVHHFMYLCVGSLEPFHIGFEFVKSE